MNQTVLFLLGSAIHIKNYKAISQKVAEKGVIVLTEVIEKSPGRSSELERHYTGEHFNESTRIIFYEEGYEWSGFKNCSCSIMPINEKTSAQYVALQVHRLPEKKVKALN